MIKLERHNHVAVMTISRPEALNALNSAMLDELTETCAKIKQDEKIRVLIVTGEGKAFVAGADIAEMKDLDQKAGKAFGQKGQAALSALENLPMPIIAAVNGYALGGGCELMLCTDIRFASERAKFGQPEVGLGITPGFGGTQRLPRLIGVSKAKELIFTGRVINAEEALKIGLVDHVVPPEVLMDEAMKLAEEIAKNAPVAVRNAKVAVSKFTNKMLPTDLDSEAELFSRCFRTDDQKMAMDSFVNKTEKMPFVGQ
ncbi:MAG: enoyl-CoA hydratase/isomerase family protein [Clostridiales bacterium]|nr:enoyl-CoA hydratase/isomerase family protein [Clostridiales bacterium]